MHVEANPLFGADPRFLEVLRATASGFRDSAVVHLLRPALDDPDPCVRRFAIPLLGRTRHRFAASTLRQAIRAPDAATREAAALGLGYADDHGAAPSLIGLLGDDAPTVRAASASPRRGRWGACIEQQGQVTGRRPSACETSV
jgi:HEAT repeat protein